MSAFPPEHHNRVFAWSYYHQESLLVYHVAQSNTRCHWFRTVLAIITRKAIPQAGSATSAACDPRLRGRRLVRSVTIALPVMPTYARDASHHAAPAQVVEIDARVCGVWEGVDKQTGHAVFCQFFCVDTRRGTRS